MFVYEEINAENLEAIAALALELWPDALLDEELENARRILSSTDQTSYVVKRGEQYLAFIYLSIRKDYVEGTHTGPVTYIEGIYVDPGYRGEGLGRKMVALGANWGKNRGCRQFASDAELDNADSIAFHRAVGFNVASRIICFVQDL